MEQVKQANEVLCPTRIDGGDPLICHQIDRSTCQSRQRVHYHKCHTCAHRNDAPKAKVSVLPPPREKPEPKPERAPVREHVAAG